MKLHKVNYSASMNYSVEQVADTSSCYDTEGDKMGQSEVIFKKQIVQGVQENQRNTDVQQKKLEIPGECTGNSKESVTVFNIGQYECI